MAARNHEDRAIPYRRIGSRILFTESDLEEYVLSVKQPVLNPVAEEAE
jgi:hypothetical protein